MLARAYPCREERGQVTYNASKSSSLHKLLTKACSDRFLIQLIKEPANKYVTLQLCMYVGVDFKDGREPRKFLSYTSFLTRLHKLLSLWPRAQGNHIMISWHETASLMV